MKRPEKILIIRTDRLGDVILSTPVIRNLRLAFPNAYIAFLCRPYTKEVLAGNPYLDEVIVYDKYDKQRSLFSSLRFCFYLRKNKFDWAIILHPTNRAHLLTFFAGIPFRAGWDKKMGFLLSKKIPHYKQKGEKHELEYTLDILRALEIPVKDKSLYFPLKKDKEALVEKLLIEHGLEKDDVFLVFHPSASCVSKRWPVNYFSSLVKLFKKEGISKIVVVTSRQETVNAGGLIKDHPDLIDLRGKLDISGLGALIKRAALFVSNDSGPVHIAASLGVPVISIFGRNKPGLAPTRWGPLGKDCFYLHKDTGCKKCFAHNCQKGFLCLKAVKPQEVFDLAMTILAK